MFASVSAILEINETVIHLLNETSSINYIVIKCYIPPGYLERNKHGLLRVMLLRYCMPDICSYGIACQISFHVWYIVYMDTGNGFTLV